MRKHLITWLAALTIIVAVLQFTPLRFLSPGPADFVAGLSAGLTIAAVFTWLSSRA